MNIYKEPLVYTDERVINEQQDINPLIILNPLLSPDERNERLLKELSEL